MSNTLMSPIKCAHRPTFWLRILALLLPAFQVFGQEDGYVEWSLPVDGAILPWGSPHSLEARASSGISVTFEVVRGPAVIAGNQITVTNSGTVEVLASAKYPNGEAGIWDRRSFNRTSIGVTELGFWPDYPQGDINDMAVRDHLAFLAVARGGLRVVDISDAVRPKPVGGIRLDGYATGIVVDGNFAYLTMAESGLHIVDVSVPASPRWVASRRTMGSAQKPCKQGSLVFVAAGAAGVEILDVSDPGQPRTVGQIATKGFAFGLQVVGDLAYVTAGEGLEVFDIGRPERPVRLGVCPLRWAMDVQVQGKLAYVADHAGSIEVVDVANPYRPFVVSSTPTAGSPRALQVAGNVAYVADHFAGSLRTFELLSPTNLVEVGTYATGGNPAAVEIQAGKAFLACGSAGFQIVDVENPSAFREVARFSENGYSHSVTTAGGLAYVADGRDGVTILDVSDPSRLRWVGGFDTAGNARNITIEGTTAYVADEEAGVLVLDVSNPGQPTELGKVATQSARSVQVVGNVAYVADGDGGLRTLDVTDPAHPSHLGATTFWGEVNDVKVANGVAVVANWAISTADVENPAFPVNLANVAIGWRHNSVRLRDSFAFATIMSGVEVIDISDPKNPFNTSFVGTEGEAFGFDFFRTIGVAATANGLQFFDQFRPLDRVAAGGHPMGRDARSVHVSGDLAYVALGESGMKVMRLREGVAHDLTFDVPASVQVKDPPATTELRLTATARSGQNVTLRVLSGPATLIGSQLTITNFGAVVVRAAAAVSEQFLAESIERVIEATKVTQTVTFELPAKVALRAEPLDLVASASSGLPVSFVVVSGPATIEGNRLVPSGPGTVWIRATQSGNEQYWGEYVERSVEVTDPPAIVSEPVPLDASPGANVALAIGIQGAEPMAFQWFQNGVRLTGAVTSSLAFPQLHPTNTGLYHVVASNRFGSVTSQVVTLTVDRPGSELSLRPRGSVPLRGTSPQIGPARMEFQGNLVYVIDRVSSGVHVFDVTNPDEPKRIASIPLFGTEHEDAALGEGVLYLAERKRGLGIVDVRNPAKPVRLPTYEFPGKKADVVTVRLRDGLAFVGNGEYGLSILDVRDPAQPVEIGSLDTQGVAAGVFLRENLAFVADWHGGLFVADVSDATQPRQIAQFPARWNGWDFSRNHYDLVLSGPTALIADPLGGLVALDVQNLADIRLGRTVRGTPWGLDAGGRFLFTADTGRMTSINPTGGLGLFDLLTPTNPVSLGRFTDWNTVYGVQLRGNRLWVAGNRFGAIDLNFAAMSPAITVQPESRRLEVGSALFLEVAATGTEPMTYQWFKGETALAAATNAWLHLAPMSAEFVGEYSVEVRNAFGKARSEVTRVGLTQWVSWLEPQTNTVLHLGRTYPLKAEASSGLPVEFRIVSGPAEINAGQVVVTNVGLVRVAATQTGAGLLPPAVQERLFNVPQVRFTERAVWPGIPQGAATTVEVSGSRACLGTGLGVAVFDVSDPANPQPRGWVATGGAVAAMRLVGDLAYVVGDFGLHIIECGESQAPRVLGRLTEGKMHAVDVLGSVAYIGATGMLVADVSNPAEPKLISRGLPIGEVTMIEVHKDRLYYGGGRQLYWLDVSDPWVPKPLQGGSFPFTQCMMLADGLAYLGTSEAVEVYDLNVSSGVQVARFPCGAVSSLAVKDSVVFAAVDTKGVLVIDFQSLSQPVLLSSILQGGRDIRLEGDKAYTTTATGFDVHDLQVLATPRRTGGFDFSTGSGARNIHVSGNTAYLATGSAGLQILELGPTNRVSRLGYFDTEGTATSVMVASNTAFLSDWDGGLKILDIGTSSHLQLIGNVAPLGNDVTGYAQILGNLAYVASSSAFRIFDVTQRQSPVELGSLPFGSNQLAVGPDSFALDSHGRFAVLSGGTSGGIVIVDVQDSAGPLTVAITQEGGPFRRVQADGGVVYASGREKGMQMFDLEDPRTPKLVGRFDSGSVLAHSVVGSLAYVADSAQGLHIVDVSSPSQPVLLGKVAIAGLPTGVQVEGDTVYLADGQGGLRVLEVELGLIQALSLDLPFEAFVGDPPLSLPVVGDSGLPVRYSVVSGPAVFDGNRLRLTGTGTAVIRAELPGDAQFLAWEREWSIQGAVVPMLSWGQNGPGLFVEWPMSLTDYALEFSSSLDASASWQGYWGQMEMVGDFWRVPLPANDLSQFFRLKRR